MRSEELRKAPYQLITLHSSLQQNTPYFSYQNFSWGRLQFEIFFGIIAGKMSNKFLVVSA